jgi:hypothetical protein
MHSSLGDTASAGLRRLESFSVYRASVPQRMRASSRAQHVVATIICGCARSSGANGDCGVKQGELFAGSKPCSRRMNHTAISAPLPRSSGIAVAARDFPRLMVIESVATGNAGATSLSSVAAGNQVLALTLA